MRIWQTHGMDKQVAKRYLLCRPEGGLNDILSEIGKCISYGKKFGRLLIVDTNSQSHDHFNDIFGNYFKSLNENLVLSAEPHSNSFDTMSVQPNILFGQVNHYQISELKKQGIGNSLSFDFSKDYSETLLVHHSNGQQKRRNALKAAANISLDQSLAEELSARLQILGKNYDAFHIRHTDYQTNFEQKIRALAPKIRGSVFLATDNRSVVDFFTEIFGQERLKSFSQLPEEIGRPLHHGGPINSILRRNTDAILDLLTITLAEHYYLFPREYGGRKFFAPYSGFSELAARLRFCPHILRSLLPLELHVRIKALGFGDSVRNIRWRYY